MVIADLSAVTHHIYGDFCVVVRFQCGCINTDFLRHLRNEGRQHRLHVIRQISAVGTGIGHQLLFIKRLGVVQRLLCCKAEDTVGIALQAGQIIEKRGSLCFLLSVHRLDHGFHGLLTFGKQLLCISVFIKTPAGCGDTVQPKLHGVEGLRLEGGDLGISHNDHCQSRCHYAANVQRLVIQA